MVWCAAPCWYSTTTAIVCACALWARLCLSSPGASPSFSSMAPTMSSTVSWSRAPQSACDEAGHERMQLRQRNSSRAITSRKAASTTRRRGEDGTHLLVVCLLRHEPPPPSQPSRTLQRCSTAGHVSHLSHSSSHHPTPAASIGVAVGGGVGAPPLLHTRRRRGCGDGEWLPARLLRVRRERQVGGPAGGGPRPHTPPSAQWQWQQQPQLEPSIPHGCRQAVQQHGLSCARLLHPLDPARSADRPHSR